MRTVFVDMVMSLDGFVAGPNNDDSGLHDWYFAPCGAAVGVIDELLSTIGAMIIGRRSFGDQPDGFDAPYKVPHFLAGRHKGVIMNLLDRLLGHDRWTTTQLLERCRELRAEQW